MFCFAGSNLSAAEEDQEIALEFYPQWYSQENYTVQSNIGIEKSFQNNTQIKYYTKPSITYALNEYWSLHGGFGLYYTDYKESNNNFEIRPFQGISHFYPLNEKWKLSSYFRVEERLHYDTKSEERENELRLRLRFRTDYRLDTLTRKHFWDKLIFGVEGFRSNNNDEIDADIQDNYKYESRVTVGLERNLSEQDKIRFELSWKYQVPPGEISDASINTFYFKIQYYPVWGEKLRNKLSNRGVDE